MRLFMVIFTIVLTACSATKQHPSVNVDLVKWQVIDDNNANSGLGGLQIIYAANNNTNTTIKDLLVVFRITSQSDTAFWSNILRDIPAGKQKSHITLVPNTLINSYSNISVQTELIKILR